MLSTANAIAYTLGITDEKNALVCHSIGSKAGVMFGDAAPAVAEDELPAGDVESDSDNSVFSDNAEYFGNYASDDGDEDFESDDDDAPAAPKAALPVARQHQAGDVALASALKELRSHEKFSTEVIDKEICKICGKERSVLQAFDTHVCEPGNVAPAVISAAAEPLRQSKMWETALASAGPIKSVPAFGAADGPRSKATIKPFPSAAPIAGAQPVKATSKLDEEALINAVVKGHEFKQSFRGANNAVVLVSGKLSIKNKGYHIKMGIASNSEADAKKMHKVIKFAMASDTDITITHKLIGSGVDALRAQHPQETIAPNVELVLNVAKKITTVTPCAN